MNFHRKLQISIDCLDSIASDLLEVASVKDKEAFRLQLMEKRFKSVVAISSLITQQDISRFRKTLARKELTYSQLLLLSKKLAKSLNLHYKTLSAILRKWV